MLELNVIVFIFSVLVVFILLAGLLKMLLENRRQHFWVLLCGFIATGAVMTFLGLGLCWQTGKFIIAQLEQSTTQTRSNIAGREETRRKHIEYLESGVPATELQAMPKDFYTFPGQNEWWRIPLVFPFQIIIVEDFYMGTLERFKGETASELSDSSTEILTFITRMAYDRKVMLFERNIQQNDAGKKEWGIFEFKTGQCTVFNSEHQMIKAAMEKDYEGDFNLHSLLYHYRQRFQ